VIQVLLVTMKYDLSSLSGLSFTVGEDEVRVLYVPTHDVELLHAHDVLADESSW
jgi:hypothetical protein